MLSRSNLRKNNWFKRIRSLGWSDFLFLPFLLLSALFWLSTELSNEIVFSKSIHLQYLCNSNMVLKDKLPDILTAQMEGKGWDLVFMKSFGSQEPFQYTFGPEDNYLSKADLISQLNQKLDNQNIQVRELYFESRAINQEKKMVRRLPVLFEGELGFDAFYKLLKPVSFTPDSIKVTGPESEIRDMQDYPVSFQQIENIHKDLDKMVALKKPLRPYILLEPETVEMHIKVEQLTQKTLSIPISLANPGREKVNIVPGKVEISFLIGLSEFPNVDASDFSAQIMLPEDMLSHQQYAVSIVKKPGNAIIQEVKPAYVDVFFDH